MWRPSAYTDTVQIRASDHYSAAVSAPAHVKRGPLYALAMATISALDARRSRSTADVSANSSDLVPAVPIVASFENSIDLLA